MSIAMTEAILLEGKKVGETIREELRRQVENIRQTEGVQLKLACVMMGQDPSAEFYRKAQEKNAAALGIGFETVPLEINAPESRLAETIKELSWKRRDVHGLIIQLPLPQHIDVSRIYPILNPQKDVEGIHPATLGYMMMRRAKLIPATALSCLTLIESTGIDFRGRDAVIVGQSAIVGRPVQLLLGDKRVTTIVCNTGTPAAKLAAYVRQADLVVACAGKPGLVEGEWIKTGAVVIDVGTTEVKGKITGDVGFEEAKKRAAYLTPVPGGVGPLTVLMLMKNLLTAYQWQKEQQAS